MSFETASIVFMIIGTILFGLILKIKTVNIIVALLLAVGSIMWSVMASKYWLPTFPESLGWCGILMMSIGILGAVSILMKSKDNKKEESVNE